jgi:hypothetical protein
MSWSAIVATRAVLSNLVKEYSIETYPDGRHGLIPKISYLRRASSARGRVV